MKIIKNLLCLTLLVCVSACENAPNTSKIDQLKDSPRELNCSYSELKKCIESYLVAKITTKKENEVRKLIHKLNNNITDKTLTFDEAIILGHSELNEKLFAIKWISNDFKNPNLKKASRMAELRNLLKDLLKSIK